VAGEYASGIRFKEGDEIRGYRILAVFDPGNFAFSGKARAPNGKPVFLKKYCSPGGAVEWYPDFVAYQTELKRRIQADAAARGLCYEFIEFFEVKKTASDKKLRAFYQVFEWIEGGTDLRGALNAIGADASAYDWSQRVVFARVMMAGIKAIHQSGIIHTDLKPENLFLLPDKALAVKYKLRVIDLDFAVLDGVPAPWCRDNGKGFVGTPGYQSPEHLAGQVPQRASDVFTCGLILGELLGGVHPSADDMDAYDERAQTGRLRPVSVKKDIDGVPSLDFLNWVINGALRPDPRKRPTADEMLKALSGQIAEWDGKRPEVLPPPPATGALEIVGSGGRALTINIGAKMGKAHFKAWGPDFERFMAPEQFRLFREGRGKWMIEHCSSATNATTANGVTLSKALPVVTGMVVALGKTGKCPVTLKLK
jgi:hypothetical protein